MINKWICLAFIVFALLRSERAQAQQSETKDFASARGEYLSTSTGYLSASYALGYKHVFDKNGFTISIDPKYTSGNTSGAAFGFQDLNLYIAKTTLHSLLYSNLSYNSRTIDRRENSDNAFANLGGEWTYPKFSLALEAGKKSLAQEFQSLTSVRENLSGAYYILRTNVSLSKNWQMRAITKTYFVIDANRRTDSDVGLMYGISPSWPWIWVGVGAEYMTNSIANTTGYWSPRQFVNVGPRFDLSFPIVGNYSFAMALNLNKYNDVDFGDGTGFYSVAKLIYGDANSMRVEGGLETISSEQNSSNWTSSMVFLGITCPF